MIKVVICDLDGLLADTESLHLQAYREIFSQYGLDITEEEYAAWWIRDGKGIRDYVLAKSLPFDPDEIRRKKTAAYDQLVVTNAEPMPGAIELLERLSGRKRLALATSSYAQSAHLVLDRLGIRSFFEVIATRESARRAKPVPEIFLNVASELVLPPSKCVVLEDAEKGLRAAVAAGMKCVVVPNRFTQGSDFSRASAVVASLDDITIKFVDSLG